MPTHSTLTSPLGTPAYAPRREDERRDLFVSPSRATRILPLVIGGIGAVIIVGGAILYAVGAIGAPILYRTEVGPDPEPRWEPNAEFSKALGAQALNNLEGIERRDATAAREREGSLLPPEPRPVRPGMTVSPPRRDEIGNEKEMWEAPVQPKPPEQHKAVPKAADPHRTLPNGYAK